MVACIKPPQVCYRVNCSFSKGDLYAKSQRDFVSAVVSGRLARGCAIVCGRRETERLCNRRQHSGTGGPIIAFESWTNGERNAADLADGVAEWIELHSAAVAEDAEATISICAPASTPLSIHTRRIGRLRAASMRGFEQLGAGPELWHCILKERFFYKIWAVGAAERQATRHHCVATPRRLLVGEWTLAVGLRPAVFEIGFARQLRFDEKRCFLRGCNQCFASTPLGAKSRGISRDSPPTGPNDSLFPSLPPAKNAMGSPAADLYITVTVRA